MTDRFYRDGVTSLQDVNSASESIHNVAIAEERVISNSGYGNISSATLSLPYGHLHELVSGTRQYEDIQRILSVDALDSISQVAMLADVNRIIEQAETNLQSPLRGHLDQSLLYPSNNGFCVGPDGRFSHPHDDFSNLKPIRPKRPPPSSYEKPSLKRSRRHEHEKRESSGDIAIFLLSAAKRKASFPLPPLLGSQGRTDTVIITATLTQLWEKYEKLSDAMDDTASDQEAFVKRLFIRSLHRSSLSHLAERIQKSKPNSFHH
jgi:hypothetical protein